MYLVDLPSLKKVFKPHFPIPQLLLDFAQWLKKCKGSIGGPKIWVFPFEEWGGVNIDPYLVPFIRTSDGSQIAFWLPEGEKIDPLPVVLVGSEGETAQLAGSLEEFLQKLAQMKTGVSDLDFRHEELTDAGPALLQWLSQRGANPPAPATVPDFKTWFQALMKTGRKKS